MKQVQIPQELFVLLLNYHLMEDKSHMDKIRIGLEKNWMQWCCMSYMGSLRLRQQRTRGRKPGRNIWKGVGYRTDFAGSGFFDDIRQERGALM